VVREGDIFTSEQLTQMRFVPLATREDASAVISYLPIYADYVAPCASMSIAIRGKEDQAPVAQDMAAETYKNLPLEGQLKVSDPEEQRMTYTLVRQPRRGEVILREDGSFLYTPKKNKVGVDSFVYTATDPAGNVSREATVTIQLMKPTDATQYTDTLGKDCRFAAEWMRNSGIFVGETISGESCFQPEKTVSRGEFIAMVVKTLEMPEQEVSSDMLTDTPNWLRPYVAAAMRAGLTTGIPVEETGMLDMTQPITGAEAAVILRNALDLTAAASTEADAAVPVWSADAVSAAEASGFMLTADEALTRGQAANALYLASQLDREAKAELKDK